MIVASAPPGRPFGPFVLCALALAFGAAADSFRPAPSAARGAVPDGAFSHANHVPIEWIRLAPNGAFASTETHRDCRGCHTFSTTADGREVSADPQPLCAECHYPDAAGKPTLDLARRVDWTALALGTYRAPDAKASPFTHGDHGKLECRACHVDPELVKTRQDFVDDVMPIPRGTSWCVTCHDPTLPSRHALAFESDAFRRTVAKLDRSPRMAHVDRFRHDEHYQVGAQDSAGGCNGCHLLTASQATDLATKEYDAATCAPCHKPQDVSQPIVFAHAEEKKKSDAALCFDHADHLTPRALADPEIKQKGCLACHVYDDKQATYLLSPGFGSYAKCAECHDRAAAADRRGLGATGAAKLPPTAKDHGRWTDAAGWGKCHLCHALDAGTPDAPRRTMKDNRPLASKARPRAGLFRITSQAHPHVTTAGGKSLDGRCVECHKAPLPELPSRVVEAKFDHASHLARTPAAGVDACAKCHQTPVYGAKTSDEIGRTYDPASCRECHLGAEPIEAPPAPDPRRAAPPFDFNHALHLGKNHPDRKGAAAKMRCDDCHDASAPFAAGSDGSIGVKSGAASCTDCHRHDDARAAITGGKGKAEVDGCVSCHSSFVPDRGEEVFTARRRITGLASGAQLHEAKDKETCGSCHKVNDFTAAMIRDGADPHVRATAKGRSPHGASGAAKYPAGESCADCHWSGWAAYPDGTLSDDLRGKTNKVAEVRSNLGVSLTGFPGLKRGG